MSLPIPGLDVAVSSQSSGNQPGGPLSWVFTEEDASALLENMVTSERVVIDLENTGLNEHATAHTRTTGGVAARVVLASLTLPQTDGQGNWDGAEPTTWVVPMSHPQSPWLGSWRGLLTQIAATIVNHRLPVENANMKYDARWIFAHTGVDLTGRITWDTMVSSHLLDENSSAKLKERVPVVFGVERWDDVDLSYPGAAEETDLWQLGEYAARDTYWTWRLVLHHRRQMFLDGEEPPVSDEDVERARLGSLASWVSMPMVNSLARVEQNGIKLDVEWTRQELDQNRQTATAALDRMADSYNMDRKSASTAATSHWFQEFTRRATEAGTLTVASMTKAGNPQWTKSVLSKQANEGSEVARLILEQRNAEKRSQFLSSWLDNVTPDGRIHANYSPGMLVTGRTSSSGPNMQQVTKKLRPAFVPSEGCYLVDFDYSQIELRVMAFIARELRMIEAFQRGDDLHRLFAARLTGHDPEDVNAEERQKAKAGNFGLVFGLGDYGFREYAEEAYGVSMHMEEASRVYETFFEMWPAIREHHARTIFRAQKTGQIMSPLGRVRRLPDIWDANPKKAKHAENAALNAPVQSMASDLLQMAAADIQGLLPTSLNPLPVRIVGTVHDSLVIEVSRDDWQTQVRNVKWRMTNIVTVLDKLGVHFDVPLDVEAAVGTRWGWHDVAEM